MDYRLLIDYEAFEFLGQLRKSDQRRIRNRLREIQAYPSQWSDFKEPDATGRWLDVTICGDFAITFWEDSVDRHVKVLEITWADS